MTEKRENLPAVIGADDDGVAIYDVHGLPVRNFVGMQPEVRAFITDVASKVATSTEEAVLDIVGSILAAESVEDVLSGGDVVHSEDVLSVPLTLYSVKWARSTFAEGLPFYALLEVSSIGGTERRLVSCSATNVVAQVWKMSNAGWLPVDVRLEQSKRPTASGFYPLRLTAAVDPKAF